jgi:hypothetical protein
MALPQASAVVISREQNKYNRRWKSQNIVPLKTSQYIITSQQKQKAILTLGFQ